MATSKGRIYICSWEPFVTDLTTISFKQRQGVYVLTMVPAQGCFCFSLLQVIRIIMDHPSFIPI